MAFDGKKFGDEVVAIVKEYVAREVGAVRSELVLTQRAVDDLTRENGALLDLLAETAAPATKALSDIERGL
jgi:hypothetical protein